MRTDGQTPVSAGTLSGLTAGGAAHRGLITCDPETPLSEVAWLMASYRIHAVLVGADEDGAGSLRVVSDSDLLQAALAGASESTSARRIAATELLTVGASETLERVAQLLVEHGVTHVVVVEDDGGPVGVVSTLDVARAISTRS